MTITTILADPSSPVLAQGLLDWANTKGGEVQDLIRALVAIAVTAFVAMTAFKSHFAIAKTLVSIVVGGVLIWATWNMTAVKDSVGDELPGTAAPATSQIVVVPESFARVI
jgi:hypothetical protein